jgi:hypothetical protein
MMLHHNTKKTPKSKPVAQWKPAGEYPLSEIRQIRKDLADACATAIGNGTNKKSVIIVPGGQLKKRPGPGVADFLNRPIPKDAFGCTKKD